MQGGGSGPGCRRPARSAALLPLPGSLSAELRPERHRSWAPAPRGPALRRLRLLAARQRDLTSAAEGPQYGEDRPIKKTHMNQIILESNLQTHKLWKLKPTRSFGSCPVFLSCRTSSVWQVTGCCWLAVAWQDRFGFGTHRLETV